MKTLEKLKIRPVILIAVALSIFACENDNSENITNDDFPELSGYNIVDTGQEECFDNTNTIAAPSAGEDFYGQDAQFDGNQPAYTLSSDGLTVYDNVTGLTWMKDADLDGDGDIDADDKLSYDDGQNYPETLNNMNYGGYNDWRVPSIKELYSLILFSGRDQMSDDLSSAVPFIDTDYFLFAYGDTDAGERTIDSQWLTNTLYIGNIMGSDADQAMFGVNFADGRIKGYGTANAKTFYVRLCRGNTEYGINDFVNNNDGTITDNATGLMWAQDDCGPQVTTENPNGETGPRSGMVWEDALAWVQQMNDENYLGYNDWRLPNAKELQSIVDYSQAPDAGSAAISSIFNITQVTNEMGDMDYPWFWTGTTHAKNTGSGDAAVYIAFGRAIGNVSGEWTDIHGAGCQRSDPKDGDLSGYTYTEDGYHQSGDNPLSDALRDYNYVRLVRDAS